MLEKPNEAFSHITITSHTPSHLNYGLYRLVTVTHTSYLIIFLFFSDSKSWQFVFSSSSYLIYDILWFYLHDLWLLIDFFFFRPLDCNFFITVLLLVFSTDSYSLSSLPSHIYNFPSYSLNDFLCFSVCFLGFWLFSGWMLLYT